MIQLPWVLALVGYLLAFGLLVRIVLQRREPTATLAWAITVLLLPYVGAIAYLLFGGRRLRRHVRRRRARAEVIEPHLHVLGRKADSLTPGEAPPEVLRAAPDLPDDTEMIQLTNRIGSRLPTYGNKVQLFANADSSYVSLERAIEAAKHHINFEYYIFEDDNTGRRFRDLLIKKAKEGVHVRVLTDGLGSFGIDDFMQPLIDAGGRWAEFLPVGLFRKSLTRANLRNHRKIAVIDGRVAYTGGANIGDEYTGRKKRVGPWRDTHLKIEGPAVFHMQEVFAEDWHFAAGDDPTDEDWFPEPDTPGNLMVQVVASGPDTDNEPIQRIFFTAITSARRRVLLTTPYFVPDQAMRVALETAALRGVDVRLLLPRISDMPLVLYAGRSYYDELLRSGVRIYEYEGGVLHAKTMVVDDRWATVGSANMDVRSFRLNFEINAAIFGPDFAGEMTKVFDHDLRTSREITREQLKGKKMRRRLFESFARILSPLL
ncbi:MAG: cardiolipin synthase [Myxococcales bacterium]|nr:cardiolipin synthase [Myxococcales bacterium]